MVFALELMVKLEGLTGRGHCICTHSPPTPFVVAVPLYAPVVLLYESDDTQAWDLFPFGT
jgi:hypothetical protein